MDNKIESGKIINVEAEIDKKVANTIESLFISSEKIKLGYWKGELVEPLFNKVGNLLENHGDVESYNVRKDSKDYPKRISNRALNLRGDSYSIRIFEEKDGDEITMRIEERLGNHNSAVVRLRKDRVAIHYGIESSYFYFSRLGLDKADGLIDLIEKKKIEEEKRPEYQKSIKIKNFFKESARVLYGELVAAVFQDYTDAKSLELNGNELIGKIGKKEDSPVAVLTNYRGSEKGVRLEIFRGRKKVNNSMGDLVCLAELRNGRSGLGFNFKPKTWLVADEYSGLLLEVASQLVTRYQESLGAGDGGGAGPH